MSASKSSAADGAGSVLAKLRQTHKAQPFVPPLDRLVIALLLDGHDHVQASSAWRRLREHFIDWNEARVARKAELARLLVPLADSEEVADRLRKLLEKLFDQCGMLDLGFLAEHKPGDSRRALLDLDANLPRDELSLILFECCPGVTMPLSTEAFDAARRLGLVGKSGTKAQLQKLAQNELSPTEAAELVYYLEQEGQPAGKKPAASKSSGETKKAAKPGGKKKKSESK